MGIKILTSIILFSLLCGGCSLDVRKATAPTNPPKVTKSDFNVSQITGRFEQTGAAKMFLWPVNICDDNEENCRPMTFEEKVVARQKITAFADDLTLWEERAEDAEIELETKYTKLKKDLAEWSLTNKCYSLCVPDGGIFCLPDEPNLEPIDDWKEPADQAEEQLIASCQVNQNDRATIDDKKALEKQEKVIPLFENAGIAGEALLNEVGNRNFFGTLNKLEFLFGKVNCTSEVEFCQKTKNQENLFVKTLWRPDKGEDVYISNFVEKSSKWELEIIEFDKKGGFLVMKMPAVDVDRGNEVYGELTYDLEFVPDGERVKVNGDIRLLDFETNQERIGRIALSGKMNPIE